MRRSVGSRKGGTPTVWVENNVWYLLYEWNDKGVWLAKTTDPLKQMWTNVQDDPVLKTGPGEYDKEMIAVDQVIKYRGAYFAFYHGSGSGDEGAADLEHERRPLDRPRALEEVSGQPDRGRQQVERHGRAGGRRVSAVHDARSGGCV